jgi:basic amino acid/polyamine antiporter, APA family
MLKEPALNIPIINKESLPAKNQLKKILGSAFGIAVMVGGIIGVGILRNPGTVAEMLQNKWLIMAAWVLGGCYVLLAINSLAELATMLPKAGGAFNYIQRAFGDYAGFLSGWFDFIINTIAPAVFAIAISEYLSLLVPFIADHQTLTAVVVLMAFTLLHMAGLKGGSITQQVTSLLKVTAFFFLILFCFLYGGNAASMETRAASDNLMASGLFIAFIRSMQLIMGTYDGWGAPVFFAEENIDPGKTLPRSLFTGALIVIFVYVLINAALFFVMPVSSIAGSKLAVADAAQLIFGSTGNTILVLIALFSLLSILNAQILICPRILYGLSRQGFFVRQGTLINKGGTPYVVLIITSLICILLVIFSSFDRLFVLGNFMTVMVSILMFSSVIRLRRSEPDLNRPFRSWGYPWTTITMILIASSLFIGYIFADTKNFFVIAILIALSRPLFFLISRRNKRNAELS